MLIVANHVTTFDGPLVQYALPKPMRRRIAVAMSGEMLEDYRHFRNPERPLGKRGFYLPGPLIYFLLTALFNVFPCPGDATSNAALRTRERRWTADTTCWSFLKERARLRVHWRVSEEGLACW
jgi:hypothetical protein